MADKEKELKKEIRKQKEELESLEKTIAWQSKLVNQLINDRDKWHIRFNEAIAEYNKTVDDYVDILDSPFWKISKPIRNILDFVRGIDNSHIEDNTDKPKEEIYDKWIENNEIDIFETVEQKYNPLISILVPVYNVKKRILEECIESVLNQTYSNWQLILVDDKSTMLEVKETLNKYRDNKNIDIIFRKNNGGISKATNTGLGKAKGDFVGFLDCDDLLAPNALYEVIKLLNENKELDFIYSDEDKISEDSKVRFMPHFKPDWSPDTLLWANYTNHFTVYRKSLMDKVGLFNSDYDGAQDYDYLLRLVEKTNNKRIGHISKVLYHWRTVKQSMSFQENAKPEVKEATKKVKEDVINRRQLDAYLDDNIDGVSYTFVYKDHNEMVSIIIPSKDNYEILKRCIESIYNVSKYNNFEIIVVDNGSNQENKIIIEEYLNNKKIKYIYDNYDFNFSKMCNIGVKHSKGYYLLFLNDDTEVIQEDSLNRMVGQARQNHIGAVGCKLLYPNSTIIQHCGVVNYTYGPSHYFNKCDDNINHYFCRNKANYNVIAVTAACLMVNKRKFIKAKGFNENLPNNYNDVDLCFKLFDLGYYNIVRNDVVLYHYESLSRGESLEDIDKMKQLIADRNKLYNYNKKYLMYDPFYNINLSQQGNTFDVDVF